MSSSSGPVASTKTDSATKPAKSAYDHLSINKLYKGKTSETVTKTVTQKHGMQTLGKVIPARRPGQVGSLKSESTSGDTNNSVNNAQTGANAVTTSNQSQVHPIASHHPPAGWSGNAPPPRASSSPRPAQIAQGIGHPQDKSWNGNADRMNSYPSQRFAQEFPSLEAGMETKTSSQHQSGPKGQDNQYGPGPVLRPQTEGSWTQGGARSSGRPGPGGQADFPGLNATREYQGPDRGNAGGPAATPMSLGQGGPNQPMANYGMPPLRGMMPPNSFMYPNGPPGPGMFYPGMPRMGMPVPPRPPMAADAPREHRDYQRGNKRNDAQRPSNHFANKPIIRDEDLKRMDEIGVQDGGWASVQDEVDYSRTISFGSDDEESKPEARSASKGQRTSYRDEEEDYNREDRYHDQKLRILERPANVAPGSDNTEERRSREGFERDRYQRAESGGKDRNREGAADVDRKHHQQGFRRPFEDKEKEDRRNNIDRGGRRRDEQGGSWRSSSARQYDDGKGPQARGDTRGPDFGKSHMNNLPPRLLRQQMNSSGTPQSQPSANSQRQTPSPIPSGKEKDAKNDWESDPDRRRDSRKEVSRGRRGDAENRNEEERSIQKDSSDSSYSRSKDTTGDDFRGYSSSRGKMSWADEMDDYEITNTKEYDDTHGRKMKTSPDSRYTGTPYIEPEFYPKEERQARVIIGKHQRKVADMQLEKAEPEPPKEKPQPVTPPAPPVEDKKVEEPQEKLSKPVSAWGERETRDKILRTEGYMGDRDERKSVDRESGLHKSPSSSSVPGKGLDDSSSSVVSEETSERSKLGDSGKLKFVQESERLLEGRRESASDISDRDHFDKDSVSSQDARGRRGPMFRGAQDKYGNVDRQKPRFERKDRDRYQADKDEPDDGSVTDRGARGGGRGRFQHNNTRGSGRPFERTGPRGSRGRGGHYHDRPMRRNDGEREAKEFQEPRIQQHPSEVVDSNGVENKPKEISLEDVDQHTSRKEQEKKYTKGNSGKKEKHDHQKGGKGGSKIQGYGPPSDQKPFSVPRNKQGASEEPARSRDKAEEIPNKEGQIPSLMAFEISPPTIPQYKGKGAREREFHTVQNQRGGMPPRMQRNSGSDYGDRDRERYPGRSKRGAKSGFTRRKGEEDASEDVTDNESDNESRKSTASGKTRKDSGESQGKKKSAKSQQAQQEKSDMSDTSSDKVKGADKKPKQVKYPPYDARSVQQQLPPRLANKQRDSQPTTDSVSTNGTSSSPVKDVLAEKDQAALSTNNAWEKPMGSFQKAVGPNISSPTPQNIEGKEQPRELVLASQTTGVAPTSPVVGSSAAATAMLDGTNPPAQTMIFENRNFRGFTDLSKSSAVKLPEGKKDVLEAAKALQGLSFGKGGIEGASDLNFGTFGEASELNQPPSSVGSTITSHTSAAKLSATSILQQTARHAFTDHQSPISPMAQELTEKIQQVKKVWENTTTSMMNEQPGGLTHFEVDVPFHGAFGSDSYKADGSGRADFGANTLQQTGFSGGSSPLSAIAKPDSSSSPSSVTSRQTSKIGPPQHTIAKAPGPAAPIATPFNNYGVDTQNPLGTKGFGNLSVVQQPKVIYQTNVPVSVDPFSSQFTQFANPGLNPGISYTQSGSMMVRPVDAKPMYNMYGQPQPQVNSVAAQSLSGANHTSVSPGPGNNASSIGGTPIGAPGSHMNRSNLAPKSSQQNRNAGVMNQSLPHPQPGYYHSHPNALSQQQLHKGAFPPSMGGFTDGSTLAAYQAQHPVLIPMENPQYNFDSGELRAGPPGPPSGTPPVQSGANHYFGANNNPLMYQSNNQPQSYGYGHPFGQSMKLPFNSTSGAADSGSNMSAQRMRDHHSYLPGGMPTNLDGLQQNMMKPNDYLLSQQRWSNDYQPMWTPTPIQRPIFQPSNPQVMSNMVQSSHYSVPGHGHVGAKSQSQSNDSMGNNTG